MRPARAPRRPGSSPSGSLSRARRGSAPTPRRTRWRSAWTPAAASTLARSPASSASTKPTRGRSWRQLVYEDPAEQRLVPAAEYLSGNVRAKLDHARRRRPRAAGTRGERAGAGAGAAGGPERGGDRAEARGGVDRRRHPPPVPRRDPRRQQHPGRASRRGDVGGQGPELERAGHQRVGDRPDARPRSGQGGLGAASNPGHRRNRRRPPRGQPDRNRRRPRESPGTAGALRRVVLGGPRSRPGTGGRVQPALQRDRAARLQHRGRAAHPARPRAHLHTALRTSGPRSPGCSPSPPSGSFTRSAPARPPRW